MSIRRRIRGLDTERTLRSFAVLTAILTLGFVLLAGTLPLGGVLTGVVTLFTISLPAVGVLVVIIAVVWANSPEGSTLPDPLPQNTSMAETHGEVTVEKETERVLDAIVEGRYSMLGSSLDNNIRDTLKTGAVTALRTSEGLDAERAREAVRNGEWTTDPVAAGFLAERPTYPLTENLRRTLDPGMAYRRRVRRTLDAIDALDATDPGPNAPEASRGSDERQDGIENREEAA